MSDSGLSITLTQAQADQLLRDAGARQKAAEVLAGLEVPGGFLASALRVMDDERYSSSLARAMIVFAAIPGDGRARSVTDLADQIGMSASAVHRYVSTFAEMGLLERDPASRMYRRPVPLSRGPAQRERGGRSAPHRP